MTQINRILYMSYDGLTDQLGPSQILPYLCGLARADRHIAIISCEKPAAFARNGESVQAITTAAGLSWIALTYRKSPPVLSTVIDIISIRLRALREHVLAPFRLVHCRSYLTSLVGLAVQKRGAKFIFDMRGFWADERVDAGLWPRTNPLYPLIYRFFKAREKVFLARADAIVSLTHTGKAEMLTWPGCEDLADKIDVIPCCVDTAVFNPALATPADCDAARARLGIGADEPVLAYLGSIGTWYMLVEMLEFFARLLKQQPNARFLFVTQEPAAPTFAKAATLGIDVGRLVITAAPRDEVPVLLSLAQFGIFFIRPTYSKMSSSPTKQGELMAMGIPVVCNSGVGDTDAIVEKYGSGVLVAEHSAAAYDAAIAQMIAERFDARAIRAGALDYFGLDKGVARYRAIYDRLLAAT